MTEAIERCSSDRPCTELNPLHLDLWGECFHGPAEPTDLTILVGRVDENGPLGSPPGPLRRLADVGSVDFAEGARIAAAFFGMPDIIEKIDRATGVCARPACDREAWPWLDPQYCSSECRLEAEHGELIGDEVGQKAWAQLQKLPCRHARCSEATCGPGEPSKIAAFIEATLGIELPPWQRAMLDPGEIAALAEEINTAAREITDASTELADVIEDYRNQHLGEPEPRWLRRWINRIGGGR